MCSVPRACGAAKSVHLRGWYDDVRGGRVHQPQPDEIASDVDDHQQPEHHVQTPREAVLLGAINGWWWWTTGGGHRACGALCVI